MAGTALADAGGCVAAIERNVDVSALRRSVREFVAPLGYDRFVLYLAPPPGEGAVGRILWLEGDWFSSEETISAEAYLARCPANRHVLETDHPFFWTKSGFGDQETYRIADHPRGSGLHGLQVPIFGHAGLLGAMSLAGKAIESSADTRLALTLIGHATFNAHVRLTVPDTRPSITVAY